MPISHAHKMYPGENRGLTDILLYLSDMEFIERIEKDKYRSVPPQLEWAWSVWAVLHSGRRWIAVSIISTVRTSSVRMINAVRTSSVRVISTCEPVQ